MFDYTFLKSDSSRRFHNRYAIKPTIKLTNTIPNIILYDCSLFCSTFDYDTNYFLSAES